MNLGAWGWPEICSPEVRRSTMAEKMSVNQVMVLAALFCASCTGGAVVWQHNCDDMAPLSGAKVTWGTNVALTGTTFEATTWPDGKFFINMSGDMSTAVPAGTAFVAVDTPPHGCGYLCQQVHVQAAALLQSHVLGSLSWGVGDGCV